MRQRDRFLITAATASLVAAMAAPALPAMASAPPDAPGPDGPAATVVGALQQTLAEPFTVDVYTDITGTSIDLAGDRPIATGVYTAGGVSVTVDLAPVFGVAGIDVSAAEGSLDVIAAGNGVYLRAPVLSSLVAAMGSQAGPAAVIGELGDQWGFVDLTATGEVPNVPVLLSVVSSMLPEALGEELTDDAVTEVGTEMVNGTTLTGYSVVLPDDSTGVLGGEVGAAAEAVAAPSIEVWVGDDGYVHRAVVTADQSAVGGLSEAVGDLEELVPSLSELDGSLGAGTLGGALRVEFGQFGDTSLSVVEPADAVDITSVLEDVGTLMSGDDATSVVAVPATNEPITTEPVKLAEMQPVTVTGAALPPFMMSGDDPAIGLPAPHLSGRSFDGSAVTYEPGRPTLIVFVTHWCPHCQAMVPELVDWEASGDVPAGLDVLAVATDTDANSDNFPPSAWLAREGFPWPVLADSSSYDAATAYGLQSFPYFVLVDPDGNVVTRTAGEMSPELLTELTSAALG